jgi:16S rRNA (cytosine1402-N4)-methyltransferase
MKSPLMTPAFPEENASSRQGRDHVSVMLDEVIAWLAPRAGGRYCDATVGMGGHTRALLERSAPDGQVIGLDRDASALATARAELESYGDRLTLVHARFSQARVVLEQIGAVPVDGFLVDLGVSSPQLDRPERGFSFRGDGPLDMRMDATGGGETAADLLRRVDEDELARILRDYGEERHATRVARFIVEARERESIDTTGQLAAIVARAVPGRERGKNPATRTFQALRIMVNEELDELERFLAVAADCLRPGGRLVVIAFHSLEDRIVKYRLRALAARGGATPPVFRLLTKHVVVPSNDERVRNRRSRSAHLRAAERI